MTAQISIRESQLNNFNNSQRLFLPNEELKFACEEDDGFIALTDRRLIRIKYKKGKDEFREAIPLNCVYSLSPSKKDHWVLELLKMDDDGCIKGKSKKGTMKYETDEIKIKLYDLEKEEKQNKESIYQDWINTMENLSTAINEEKEKFIAYGQTPPIRDFSYLDDLPNKISDYGIDNFSKMSKDLLPKANDILGDNPHVFYKIAEEESIDWSGDVTHIFGVGIGGIVYYGKRYYQDGNFPAEIELVELALTYDKLKSISFMWDKKRIIANYVEEKKGEIQYHKKTDIPKIKRNKFNWLNYRGNDWESRMDRFSDTPWLAEPLNGPWIMVDSIYKICGKAMPINCLDLDKTFKKRDRSEFQLNFLH